MISTICCIATERSRTLSPGRSGSPNSAINSRAIRLRAGKSTRPPLMGRLPTKMFSATLRSGNIWRSW